MNPPAKTQVLPPLVTKVKRWRVWVGSTAYKPLPLTEAWRFAREKMWGGNQVITLEPVLVAIVSRRRKNLPAGAAMVSGENPGPPLFGAARETPPAGAFPVEHP